MLWTSFDRDSTLAPVHAAPALAGLPPASPERGPRAAQARRSIGVLMLALVALLVGCGSASEPQQPAPKGSPPSPANAAPVASAPAEPPAQAGAKAGADQQACAELRPTAPMHEARINHHALRLADGRVMVAGGLGATHGRVELFDPRTEQWTRAPDLPKDLHGYAVTSLADGSVLVTGASLASAGRALRFDAASDRWVPAAQPAVSRVSGHTLTLLDDGTVLLVGGSVRAKTSSGAKYIDITERYDPKTNAWRGAGKLEPGRVEHVALKLSDGNALVVGGFVQSEVARQPETVALYEPGANAWRPLKAARTGESMAGAVLEDGRALIVVNQGKTGFALQTFDPASGAWRHLCSVPNGTLIPKPLTVLPGGELLAVGFRDRKKTVEFISLRGQGVAPDAVKDPERDVLACSARSVSAPDDFSAASMTATILGDGRVLIAGGQTGATGRDTAGSSRMPIIMPSNRAWLLGPCKP